MRYLTIYHFYAKLRTRRSRLKTDIFSGKYFRLTYDTETGYEQVHQRHGVTVFPITHAEEVRLVIKNGKRPTPLSAYIEAGEDPLDCAKRELGEEMGLTAEKWRPLPIVVSEGGLEKIQYFFVAKGLKTLDVALEPDVNENIVGTEDITFQAAKKLIISGEFDYAGAENCLSLLRFILAPVSES